MKPYMFRHLRTFDLITRLLNKLIFFKSRKMIEKSNPSTMTKFAARCVSLHGDYSYLPPDSVEAAAITRFLTSPWLAAAWDVLKGVIFDDSKNLSNMLSSHLDSRCQGKDTGINFMIIKSNV